MSKLMKIAIPLLMVLVLATSCASRSSIKIGFMGTISGPHNDLAVNGLNGVEIALQEINEAGGIKGRNIELVVKDTLNDTEITKNIVDEFISERVKIVIGDYTSTLMEAALDYDKNDEILFLSPTASADKFSELDDNLIRFIGTTKMQAEVTSSQILKNDHKKIIVIKDKQNEAFVKPLFINFKKILEDAGGSIIDEINVGYSEVGISTQLLEGVLARNPSADAIFLLLDAFDTTYFLQSLNEIKTDISIYTPLWANTNDLFRLGRNYIDGIYTTGFYRTDAIKGEAEIFRNSYSELFGTEPSFSAYFSYDVMMILHEGLMAAGSNSKSKIKHKLLNPGKYDGIVGSFELDENGDCSREFSSLRIINEEVIDFLID